MKNEKPQKKVSEIILEFGEPILSDLPVNHTKEEFEGSLRFIVCVWNAIILDVRDKCDENEKTLLHAISHGPPFMIEVLKMLILRKKTMYAKYLYGIGDYQVIERDGGFVFRAEARARDKKDLPWL